MHAKFSLPTGVRPLLGAALLSATGACHSPTRGADTAHDSHPERIAIGRTCAQLEGTGAPTAVFVELAELESPTQTLSLPPAKVRQIAGVLLQDTREVSLPGARSEDCGPGGCTEAGLGGVRASRFPSTPEDSIELEVSAGADGTKRLGLVATDQKTKQVLLPQNSGSLVVTPYYLFGARQASLESLHRCKLQR